MTPSESKLVEHASSAPARAEAVRRDGRGGREKDLRIESLRGLAIILMVAGHVIGDSSNAGMRVDDSSGYRYFYYSLSYLRMPLFTVISGFVYSLAPARAGSIRRFLLGKGRRILLPFFCVMTLQYLLRIAAPGVNNRPLLSELPLAYIYGFDQFWFLQMIFLIFLMVGALDVLGCMKTFPRWAFVFAGAACLDRLGVASPIFSSTQAVQLSPFFLLGCGIQRFPSRLFHPATLGTAGVLLAIGVVMQQGAWFGHVPADSLKFFMIPTVVGLMGNLLLMRFFPIVWWLVFYGSHAYTIFLLHVFFTAGTRIALNRVGLAHHFLVFPAALLAGITLPIAAESWLARNWLLRRTLLGLR
jgi:fucose 4-O-acetylase-like acetyltransferase